MPEAIKLAALLVYEKDKAQEAAEEGGSAALCVVPAPQPAMPCVGTWADGGRDLGGRGPHGGACGSGSLCASCAALLLCLS